MCVLSRTEADQLATSLQTLDLLQVKLKKQQQEQLQQQHQLTSTTTANAVSVTNNATGTALYQHVVEQEKILAERVKTKTVSTRI